MKRRNFLLVAASSLVAVSIPTTYFYLGDVVYEDVLAQPQALFLIWDSPMVVDIGNRYRFQVPSEKSKRSLVNLLSEPLSDSHAIALSLEQKIKKDFEAGNTVTVDGWILSITEARQCALSSTTQPKG